MKHASHRTPASSAFSLSRRGFLQLCVSATGLAAASARADGASPAPRSGSERGLRWLEFGLAGPDGARSRALLFKPAPERPGPAQVASPRRYPALLLLHGAGGSDGLQAWRSRYGLFDTYADLQRPPLAFNGERARFLRPEQLARINTELEAQPFKGLVLICPMPPAVDGSLASERVISDYCDWLESTLLPRAVRLGGVDETPCLGLVGYASGASLALEVFARKPQLFRTFGVAQPRLEQAPRVVARRLRNAAAHSGFAGIQLQTSSGDGHRAALRALHRELTSHAVAATLDELRGPADDASWRAAGLLSVLAWHERRLQLVESIEPNATPVESDPAPVRPPGPPAHT